MHSLFRLTSESSDSTNASGSTDQTDISLDDVSGGTTKSSKPYKEKGTRYTEATPYSPAIDSNSRLQGRDFTRLDLHDTYIGELSENIAANRQGPRQHSLPENNDSANGESVPLLSRSELEYTLDIICSQKIKKLLKAEHEDVDKLRRNYKSLKKIFLALAVLTIILILCVVSVMPVILVSARLEGSQVMQTGLSMDSAMEEFVLQKLVSPRAREIIRKNVFCGYCGLPKEAKSHMFRDYEDLYRKECCDQDIFTIIQKLKINVSERLTAVESDKEEIHNSIHRLDGAVVGLENVVYRDSKDSREKQDRGSFQKTLVHQRVDSNNHLLNVLLNRERSLLQMTGTAVTDIREIVWEADVSNGKLVSIRNNSIHVTGGGTYFLYAKIQFSKRIRIGTEMLEYHVMKEKEGSSDPPDAVAHVKQSCTKGRSLELALTVQKVVVLDRNERAIFRIQYNSDFYSYLSGDLKTHYFGIFEI